MPRSLCAAKRQIKETVIGSTASAADSYVAVAELASGAECVCVCEGGGLTLHQGGKDEGEDGAARCRSTP